jgi:hypothetical protein
MYTHKYNLADGGAQLGGGSDVVKQIQYEIRRDKALKEFMDDDDEDED